jgi:hypothetical protein
MIPSPDRPASEWYREASRAYVEGHQACAWCGSRHQVFKTERLHRVEYACAVCEFYVGHDSLANRYVLEPGRQECPTADVVVG